MCKDPEVAELSVLRELKGGQVVVIIVSKRETTSWGLRPRLRGERVYTKGNRK